MPLPDLFRTWSLPGINLGQVLSRTRAAMIYEVDLRIEGDVIDEFDAWLKTHMREMLAFPGFQEAEAFVATDIDESGRHRRVATYVVRSRRELESYLHTHASRMRSQGIQRFGKAISASRRILPQDRYQLPEGLHLLYSSEDISGGLPVCSNCHQPVPGKFCATCGQEDRTYLLSLGQLLLDFFGDLVNFDSRFFRTTIPLVFQPGYLTAEYIRGRRQAYFPPVRLYIFISIIFFFVASVLTDASVDELEARNAISTGEIEPSDTAESRKEQIREILATRRARLEEAGLLEEAAPYLPTEEELIARSEEKLASGQAGPEEAGNNEGRGNSVDKPIDANSGVTVNATGIPEIDDRIERGAEAVKENPKAFLMALMNDIPVMMFVFLPLIALVLKLLYFFTGRYYVEHLIFTLHYHAAVFILMLLLIVNIELAAAYDAWQRVSSWVTTIIWIYIPVYLFLSMRVVYGQGRLFTGLKFFLLLIAYILAAATTIGATVMIGLWRQG